MNVEMLSPIPGKVLMVMVNPGDSVSEDEELVTIESMKMENAIYAPVSGRIREIKVKINDEVEVDDLLIVIEP